MAFSTGTRLGTYEIVAAIGAGGMGEVYRARDTKLGRDVAIKVLPGEFSQDKERLTRFEREARLLASLNHPGIATLYGLEVADDVPYIVMELVEGETLAARIAREALTVDEARELFKQIAEALEAAHEKGVIHRDLKPANIKVTPGDQVKILDFGLGKFFEEKRPASDLSESPTVTRGTVAGVILGTAPYMSPEQARGKPVDKRTDIWAFGCCLYEALSGRAAFLGETVTDTIVRILEREPDWQALPAGTPASIRQLLRRCLTKDVRYRLRDVGDAWVALQTEPGEPLHAPTARTIPPAFLVLGALFVFVAGLLARNVLWPTNVPREMTKRFTVKLNELPIWARGDPSIAVSPDGTTIAYVSIVGGRRHLVRRRFDELEGETIPGTEDATAPFFSPDGEWIGFLTYEETQGDGRKGELKKVPVSGGLPVTLADAMGHAGWYTAAWGDDDRIVFPSSPGISLSRISAAGGTPEPLATTDDGNFESTFPNLLPGSQSMLFAFTDTELDRIVDRIVASSFSTGERTVLIEDGVYPRYVPTGHIVYSFDGNLMAVPFDVDELKVAGPAVPLIENVRSHWAFSHEGTLVYRQQHSSRSLVWVDRLGEEHPLPSPEHAYYNPRISPDGTRVAMNRNDAGGEHIWIYEIARESLTRLTTDPYRAFFPVWSPDGRRVAFNGGGMFWTAIDGSQPAEPLSEQRGFAYAMSPDGKYLVFEETTPDGSDIGMLSMDEPRTLQKVIDAPFDQSNPTLSRDGQWIAYESNESGRVEVYVQAFPEVRDRWKVSTERGRVPVWGPNARELFYRNGDDMMVVPVETSPTFTPGRPEILFSGAYYAHSGRAYDIAPDGERFLMIKPDDDANAKLNVVLNWFDELERLVPPTR